MEGYARGRINRIKIRNFMTYDHVELKPRKGLNLIVGLNGSGKSSIMCAICLGLAGKPLFTGRATQLSDFIKHGCQEAEIEIELEKEGGPLSIQRKIKGDKCEWFLNRSSSSQTEVAQTVQQYNIDTSNLCQFLPQEKVVEISKMDKKQRLVNMLQAIGEPHLFELFNELKKLHGQTDDIQLEIKRYQSKKNSAEEENERVSDEVNKQENRVRLRRELNELEKQKKIVNYQMICEELAQLKQNINDQKQNLASIKERHKETRELEDSMFNSYRKYSDQKEQFMSRKKNVTNKITKASSSLTLLKEQVENANIEYKNRVTEAENQKKRLHDLNKQIEGLKNILIEGKSKYEECKEKFSSNSHQLSQLQQEWNFLSRQLEAITAERNKLVYSIEQLQTQLSALQNEDKKKMDNLKKRDKYAYQAASWLLENRNKFKSNICLPVMLEIKVYSSENCKYVESAIPFRDMIAFVCEDKSDCEKFTDIMSHKGIPVNVVMVPDTPLAYFATHPMTQEYKQCGLQCYVSDLFTAPDPVMRYLCACHRLHCIPVSTTPVQGDKIKFVLERYRIFFTDNFRVTGKRSRYGNKNWSERKDFILDQHLLTINNDELQNQVQQQLQDLQNQNQSNTEQMMTLNSKREDLEKNQEKLRQDKKTLQDWENGLRNNQKIYEQKLKLKAQISIIDVNEKKVQLGRKIKSINEQREKVLGELNQLLKEYTNLEKEIIKVIMCMNHVSRSLKQARDVHEEANDKIKSAELALDNVQKQYRERRGNGRRLYAEIRAMGEKYVKILEESDSLHHPRLTLEEVVEKINHIQAQLNVDEDNEPLVSAYHARKEKIEDYQMQIDCLMGRLEETKANIQTKKTEWLKPLQKHIANINRKFSRYFKKLNFVGEISLDIPDDQDDFEKYGLQIKLKFHDEEPFTDLSQVHHSGGECCVAAIVFILSLQELTDVPFRCIDEINQGMDSVNERKIYQLIADSVSDGKCSQYFLLTPKLLNDLQYPEDVAVHIIFNSSYLHIKLDVPKHLEIAQSV